MVIQYKCPKCGSDMSYDPNTRKLTCPNCGHAADIEKFPLPEKAPENDEVEEFCHRVFLVKILFIYGVMLFQGDGISQFTFCRT